MYARILKPSRWLAILTLSAGLALPGLSGAGDPAAARQYFDQAVTQPDPQAKLKLLDRSLAAQPTFEAWFAKGQIYFQLQQPTQALAAYEQAKKLAGNDRATAMVWGRSAEVLASQGGAAQRAEAVNLARKALKRYPSTEMPPEWLTGLNKRLDNEAVRRVDHGGITPSREIQVALLSNTSKRFAVVPSIDLHINFDYDKATLSPSGVEQVKELADAVGKVAAVEPDKWYKIIGHTDRKGSDEYNLKLSQRRAETVRNEVARKVPGAGGHLCTEGKGKSEMLSQEKTEEADKLNRRVQVELVDSCP